MDVELTYKLLPVVESVVVVTLVFTEGVSAEVDVLAVLLPAFAFIMPPVVLGDVLAETEEGGVNAAVPLTLLVTEKNGKEEVVGDVVLDKVVEDAKGADVDEVVDELKYP